LGERLLTAGDVCLAERQTAGRGRRGRAWVSPFGQNLYLSVRWRYGVGPAELGGLSLACGVAVALTLRALGAEGVGLKWPNDIHWRRRKLAGLLLEVAGEAQGPSDAVVGLGLNLRLHPAQAAEIEQPWIDLNGVLKRESRGDTGNGRGRAMPSRHRVAAALINALLETLDRYRETGLAPFLEDWHELDVYQGEPVTLIAGEQRISGVYRGIDAHGALLLEQVDGRQRTFAAGEVSLRAPIENRESDPQ
jgi:BirA family biotin operon repressor/biotin-[acetyl-CoA-carboxylase] ligase